MEELTFEKSVHTFILVVSFVFYIMTIVFISDKNIKSKLFTTALKIMGYVVVVFLLLLFSMYLYAAINHDQSFSWIGLFKMLSYSALLILTTYVIHVISSFELYRQNPDSSEQPSSTLKTFALATSGAGAGLIVFFIVYLLLSKGSEWKYSKWTNDYSNSCSSSILRSIVNDNADCSQNCKSLSYTECAKKKECGDLKTRQTMCNKLSKKIKTVATITNKPVPDLIDPYDAIY